MPKTIMVFDGVCLLCSRTLQFVLKRDKAGQIYFASMQGEAGQKYLQQAGLDATDPDSFLLIDDEGTHQASDAIVRILRTLKAPWPWIAKGLSLIPKPIRDRLYFLVARNRYSWFGQHESCLLPHADLKQRFLD